MDLTNPWSLLSGILVGLLGLSFLVYGKKQQRMDCLAAGAILSVVAMVAHSVLLLWALTGACIGGVWALGRR